MFKDSKKVTNDDEVKKYVKEKGYEHIQIKDNLFIINKGKTIFIGHLCNNLDSNVTRIESLK